MGSMAGAERLAAAARVPCACLLQFQTAVVLLREEGMVLLSVAPGASSGGEVLGMRVMAS